MKLSSTLRANAVFSASCALICLFAADFVIAYTLVPSRFWIIGLGIMLLSFVPMLLLAAARPSAWLVRTIIILDWGYVAIALIYYLLNWRQVDSIGAALILLPSAFVALFALLQQSGLAAIPEQARI
jgi:hypothetical protein